MIKNRAIETKASIGGTGPRYSLRRNMPKESFKSMSFMDSSSYSNVMGKEDFKRKMRGHKNIEGQESGIEVDQDNNLIRIKRYPN